MKLESNLLTKLPRRALSLLLSVLMVVTALPLLSAPAAAVSTAAPAATQGLESLNATQKAKFKRLADAIKAYLKDGTADWKYSGVETKQWAKGSDGTFVTANGSAGNPSMPVKAPLAKAEGFNESLYEVMQAYFEVVNDNGIIPKAADTVAARGNPTKTSDLAVKAGWASNRILAKPVSMNWGILNQLLSLSYLSQADANNDKVRALFGTGSVTAGPARLQDSTNSGGALAGGAYMNNMYDPQGYRKETGLWVWDPFTAWGPWATGTVKESSTMGAEMTWSVQEFFYMLTKTKSLDEIAASPTVPTSYKVTTKVTPVTYHCNSVDVKFWATWYEVGSLAEYMFSGAIASGTTGNLGAIPTTLQAYRAATMYPNGSNWEQFSYANLVLLIAGQTTMAQKSQKLVDLMNGMPTAQQNVANLKLRNEPQVLKNLGLASAADVVAAKAKIQVVIDAINALQYADYFQLLPSGVRVNTAAWSDFTTAVPPADYNNIPSNKPADQHVGSDTSATYTLDGAGGTLNLTAELETALSNYNELLSIKNSLPEVWAMLEDFYFTERSIQLDLAGDMEWIDNLREVIALWKLNTLADSGDIQELIGLKGKPFHNNPEVDNNDLTPDAPEGTPDDSTDVGWIYSNAQIWKWYLKARDYIDAFQHLKGNFSNSVVNSINWTDLQEVAKALFQEILYRAGLDEDYTGTDYEVERNVSLEMEWFNFHKYFNNLYEKDFSKTGTQEIMDLLTGKPATVEVKDGDGNITTPEAPPVPSEVLTEYNKYKIASEKAKEALAKYDEIPGSNALWEEIYKFQNGAKSHEEMIVKPAIHNLYVTLANRLTQQVDKAMSLILKVQNEGNGKEAPGQSALTAGDDPFGLLFDASSNPKYILNFTTVSELKQLIQSLNQDSHALLKAYDLLYGSGTGNGLSLLGNGASAAWQTRTGESSAVQTDKAYEWLLTVVFDLINGFYNTPEWYFEETNLPDLNRPSLPEDIVPETHIYTESNDEKVDAAIAKFDKYLGSGGDLSTLINALLPALSGLLPNLDLAPIFEMLGVGYNAAMKQITGPLNIQTIVDGLLKGQLYSDKIVNMIIQMVYPAVLGAFEGIWKDTIAANQGYMSRIELIGLGLGDAYLDFYTLYTVLEAHEKNYKTMDRLNLYPTLLVDNQAKFSAISNSNDPITGFAAVWNELNALKSVENPKYGQNIVRRWKLENWNWAKNGGDIKNAANWSAIRGIPQNTEGSSVTGHMPDAEVHKKSGTNDVNTDEKNLYVERMGKLYPTNAWSPEECPSIYDDEGNLNLPWNINGNPARFKAALSQVFKGLYPLLSSLLFDVNQGGYNNRGNPGNVSNGWLAELALADGIAGLQGHLQLYLQFAGNPGYANLLTPIFELLLGEDTSLRAKNQFTISGTGAGTGLVTSIPTVTQLQAAGNSYRRATDEGNGKGDNGMDMVNCIFAPIEEFLDRLTEAPLSTILNVLPNAAFALTFDRVAPLLDWLKLDISYGIKGYVNLAALGTLFGWILNAAGLSVVDGTWLDVDALQDMSEYSGGIKQPIMEMLGGALDLSFLSDFTALLGMILGLPVELLPSLNPSRMASMGELKVINSVRGDSPNRYYIKASKADIFKEMISWVFRMGILPTAITDENLALAAITELLAPQRHEQKYMEYPEPQFPDPAVASTSLNLDWWGETGWKKGSPDWEADHGDGNVEAAADIEYLVANASVLIDIVFGLLFNDPGSSTPTNLSDVINGVLAKFGVNDATFTLIVTMIQDLLDDPTVQNLLTQFDAALNHVILTKTKADDPYNDRYKPVHLIREVVTPLTKNEYSTTDGIAEADKIANGGNGNGEIDTVQELVNAFVHYLKPIESSGILDFLLAGQDLGLVELNANKAYDPNASDKGALVELKGYDGYGYGLRPLLRAFTLPLGLEGTTKGTMNSADFTVSTHKLAAILQPIVNVFLTIMDNPIDSIMLLVPNLMYFISNDTSANHLPSPLESSVNKLLESIYVVLDTIRPVVNVFSLIDLTGVAAVLPAGVTLKKHSPSNDFAGIGLDIEALLTGLLGGSSIELPLKDENGTAITVNPVTLIKSLVVGTKQTFANDVPGGLDTYVEANKGQELLALLDGVGILNMLGDWRSLTKMIQYKRIPGLGVIDYNEEEDSNSTPSVPKMTPQVKKYVDNGTSTATEINYTDASNWFQPKHGQYLADNADLVLNWIWRELVFSNDIIPNSNDGAYTSGGSIRKVIENLFTTLTAGVSGIQSSDPSGFRVKETLSKTILQLWPTADVYVTPTLEMVVNLVTDTVMPLIAGINDLNALLGPTIANLNLAQYGVPELEGLKTLRLTDLIAKLIKIGDTPLNLEVDNTTAAWDTSVFKPFVDFKDGVASNSITINSEEDLLDVLSDLFEPFFPIINFLLTGKNIKILDDAQIVHNVHEDSLTNETSPNTGWVAGHDNDQGLLTLYGYDGYENGLMPLLLALGADVPGYQDRVLTLDQFKELELRPEAGKNQFKAIIEPIFFLLNELTKNPVQTLLKVLPNVAYILLDGNSGDQTDNSVLQQAFNRLIQPVTNVIDFVPVLYDLVYGKAVVGSDGKPVVENGKIKRETVGLLASLNLPFALDNLQIGALVNKLLEDNLGTIELARDKPIELQLEDLLFGEKWRYAGEGHYIAGKNGYNGTKTPDAENATIKGADYIHVNMGDLLVSLLDKVGAFDLVTQLLADNNISSTLWLTGLMDLLTEEGLDLGAGMTSKIDYAMAGDVVSASDIDDIYDIRTSSGATWFTRAHSAYLVDNLDLVINWLWREIVWVSDDEAERDSNSEAIRAIIGNLLSAGTAGLDGKFTKAGVGESIKSTLTGTVEAIWGADLFVHDNFISLVGMLQNTLDGLGLISTLKGLDVSELAGEEASINLLQILKKTVFIGEQGLDIEAALNAFAAVKPENYASNEITTEDQFIDELAKLVGPIMPVLNVFLAGDAIKVIKDEGTGTLDEELVNGGKGFLQITGFDGYGKSLLPILMALCGGVDAARNELVGPEVYAGYASNPATAGANQFKAIIKPILALINALIKNPIQTVLKVLPNLAYLVSNAAAPESLSILQQALNNLLNPIAAAYGLAEGLIGKSLDEIIGGLDLNAVLAGLGLNLPVGVTLNTLDGLTAVPLEALIDGLLGGVDLSNMGITFNLKLADLLVGEKSLFDESLQKVGEFGGNTFVADYADYIAVDMADLVSNVLYKAGVLTFVSDQGLTGLMDLLTEEGVNLNATQRINYIDTAPTADVDDVYAQYDWFSKERHSQFLVDNLDLVINWAWKNLIIDEPAISSAIENLLENEFGIAGFEFKDTLVETITAFFGSTTGDGDFFIEKNFILVMETVQTLLKTTLDVEKYITINGEDIGGDSGKNIDLLDILEKTIYIGNNTSGAADKLDLHVILDQFLNFDASSVPPIRSEQDFKNAIVDLVAPVMPILSVFLAGNSIKIIKDQGTHELVNDGRGFIQLRGFEGYNKGLLPLLMALCGGVEDARNELVGGEEFALASTEKQVEALFNPILALLQNLLDNPIQTVMQVLPNVAYLLANGAGNNTENSLLQQILNNFLNPARAALRLANQENLLDNLDLGDININALDVETIINDLLGGIKLFDGIDFALELQHLIVGSKTPFGNGLEQTGIPWEDEGYLDGYADYIAVDMADLLTQLLDKIGVLEFLEQNDLGGLLDLIGGELAIPAIGPIDYSVAPEGVAGEYPAGGWFNKQRHAQFLVDNADAVIDWVWREIFVNNPDAKNILKGTSVRNNDIISGLLGDIAIDFEIQDSLEATVSSIFGMDLYVKDNFVMIVDLLKDLLRSLPLDMLIIPKETLGGNEDLDLLKLIKKFVTIGGVGLDVRGILDSFLNFDTSSIVINSPKTFRDHLVKALSPLMPILDFILSGSAIKLVEELNDGNGFIAVYGYEGYKYGLLPILMALGAGVEGPGHISQGYTNALVSFEEFAAAGKTGETEVQVGAIIDPILYLLERISVDPVRTLMQVVPNLVYFISDEIRLNEGSSQEDNCSLLQQAVNRLLHPITVLLQAVKQEDIIPDIVTNLKLGTMLNNLLKDLLPNLSMEPFPIEDLITGTVVPFDEPLKLVGMLEDPPRNGAAYVDVDRADFLAQLLSKAGAYKMLEDNNLTGVINLINPEPPAQLLPIVYVATGTMNKSVLYPTIWWQRAHASFLVDHMDEFLNKLWVLLFGKPFGTLKLEGITNGDNFLKDLLGDALYTQQNFNALLGAIQGILPGLDDMEIAPNRTLGGLLRQLVTVDGKKVDVLTLLKSLKTWAPKEPITNQETFMNALLDYLEPAGPLLDWLLNGEDIQLLTDDAVNSGDGLAKIYGYRGYQFGLIPLYEALLKPLGAEKEITTPATFKALNDRDKLEAVLHPIFYAVEQLVQNPFQTLIQVLPTLAYILSNEGRKSYLQQSIDRVVFAVNDLFNKTGLGALLGITPVSEESLLTLDVHSIINGLIDSFGLKFDVLEINRLMIGTFTDYVSLSGSNAKYLKMDKGARGDMLTALIRLLIRVYADNMDLILNMLLGSLSGTTYKVVMWIAKTLSKLVLATKWGTDMAINSVFVLVFFANKTVSGIFNRWTWKNKNTLKLYDDLLNLGSFTKKFATGLNDFFNKYFRNSFTMDAGYHQFGLIAKWTAIFEWFKNLFTRATLAR